MNREKRRQVEKTLRARGVSQEITSIYTEALKYTDKKQDVADAVPDGALVKINVEKIRSRKDYSAKSEKYKQFVDDNEDAVFTARLEHGGLMFLEESPEWLFWCGDLISVSQAEDSGNA